MAVLFEVLHLSNRTKVSVIWFDGVYELINLLLSIVMRTGVSEDEC